MNAKKWIVSIAIAFLLVSTFFSNIVFNGDVVSAHSGDVLIAWASVIPIIDGVISPAEWDDADSVSFLLEYSDLLPETVAHEATVYVKNDETYLYLAVVVKGDDFNPNDFGNWRFDNDNNGVIEVGDDGLSIRSDGLSTDRYRTEAIEGWWSSDVYDGGTNDIVGEVSHTNPSGVGDYTFEYRHPLDTADNGHDFSLKPGETVGFQLRYADGGPGGGGDEWPEPPDYGDIVIAEPDTAPPEIVEGPGVSAITANSALISWETDEDSDSVVKYDKASRKYDFEKKDSKMVRNHRITLADLEPSTVYHFMIQSADSAGNTVESRDKIFETLPLLDEEDPSVFIEDPGICNGITEIVAPAFDNIGVERVEFYLEDELMFIDYSSPFVFHLDTFGLENGLYSLKAKAFDFAGRIEIDVQDVEIFNPLPDFDNPSVLITYPSQGDTVSGIVEVQIHAVDTYKENEQQPVSRLEIYIDDALRHSINLALFDWHVPPHWVPEPEHPFDYRYYWDTRTVENGEHFITAIAYDDEEILPLTRELSRWITLFLRRDLSFSLREVR